MVSTCMHSRCVSTPMTRGKLCPWMAAVIKDGLWRSSRTDCGGHQGRIAAAIKDGLRRSSREEEAIGDQRIVVY